MKIQNYLLIGMLFLSILSFNSCVKDQCELTRTFIRYNPVFMTKAEMRKDGMKAISPIEMKNTGKIYFYGKYIFINEIRKGIHIIDNSDPKNPNRISFLKIPGNMDITIKNNVIYAQSFIDLWKIDISDATNPVLLAKTLDVFEDLYRFSGNSNRAIVYYDETDITEVVSCNDDRFRLGFFRRDGAIFFDEFSNDDSKSNGGNSNQNGIAGSFARMRIVGDYLYSIDKRNLYVISISGTPELVNTVKVGWNIETLFPYKDKLFIGSTAGMFIFDNSNPVEPKLLSKFYHTSSCDPVFVKDDLAFITLRNGNKCSGYTNQMEVVDISNIRNPKLIKKYSMDNPHGLSIDENILFLCDGKSGLKVFDIENVEKIKQIDDVKDIDTYDVISLSSEKIIFVIGKDGLYQFDVSDPKNVKELSFMGVEKS